MVGSNMHNKQYITCTLTQYNCEDFQNQYTPTPASHRNEVCCPTPSKLLLCVVIKHYVHPRIGIRIRIDLQICSYYMFNCVATLLCRDSLPPTNLWASHKTWPFGGRAQIQQPTRKCHQNVPRFTAPIHCNGNLQNTPWGIILRGVWGGHLGILYAYYRHIFCCKILLQTL